MSHSRGLGVGLVFLLSGIVGFPAHVLASEGAAVAAKVRAARKAPNYGTELRNQLENIGESFALLVEVNAAAREAGIDSEVLQGELRRLFKNQGIQIRTKLAAPLLTLSFSAKEVQSSQEKRIYVLNVELSAKEPALTLNRKDNATVMATLWSRSATGLMAAGDATAVLGWTRALVDVFGTDYKKANRSQARNE